MTREAFAVAAVQTVSGGDVAEPTCARSSR